MLKHKPYRPSNGTEGDVFRDGFCDKCKHDKAFFDWFRLSKQSEQPEGCTILAKTFRLSIDDSEYPKEWRYDKNNKPVCTAFEEKHSDGEKDE